MVYTCSTCGRQFVRIQNLNWHQLAHEPKFKTEPNFLQPNFVQPKQPVTTDNIGTRLNMLEDAIEVMTTGSGFVGSQQHYNPFFQQQPQQPVKSSEDDFDKFLDRYHKILLIKELKSGSGTSVFKDLMMFQQFLDNREIEQEPEEEDGTTQLLNALASKYLGVEGLNLNLLSKKKPTETEDSQMMNLPTEQTLLSLTDAEIVKKLQPYKQQMVQLKLTREQAYQNILNFYPNFPEDRFKKIWGLLIHGRNENH